MSKKDLTYWKNQFAISIGDRVGTEKSRRDFSDAIFINLGNAIPEAFRSRNKAGFREFHEKIEIFIDAYKDLEKQANKNGPKTLKLMSHLRLRINRGDDKALDKCLSELLKNSKQLLNEMNASAKGCPSSDGEYLAELIGELYMYYFEKHPASSRETGSPFQRICIAVNELLESQKKKIKIGQPTIEKTVKKLKTLPLRKKYIIFGRSFVLQYPHS